MNQPTPSVSHADVERVVSRDFAPGDYSTVISILSEYGSKDFHREKDRVQLAVLKLARGRLDALRREIEGAKFDYRDTLLSAEYPRYAKKMFRIDKLPEAEQAAIIDADWKQYNEWFSR